MDLDLVSDSDNEYEHVWYKMQPNYGTTSTSLYNYADVCMWCMCDIENEIKDGIPFDSNGLHWKNDKQRRKDTRITFRIWYLWHEGNEEWNKKWIWFAICRRSCVCVSEIVSVPVW